MRLAFISVLYFIHATHVNTIVAILPPQKLSQLAHAISIYLLRLFHGEILFSSTWAHASGEICFSFLNYVEGSLGNYVHDRGVKKVNFYFIIKIMKKFLYLIIKKKIQYHFQTFPTSRAWEI